MSMYYCMQGAVPKPTVYVVACKRCQRHIPAGVDKFPDDNIRVDCPLCGEKRRYRRAEVYLGWPDQVLTKQQVQRAEHYRVAAQKKRA